MLKNEATALIAHLEQLIHDLGQPLLAIRFATEILSSRSEIGLTKEDLATKISLISQAIDESNAISNALSGDLEKLKQFL